MNFIYLKNNDKPWFKIAKYTIRLLAVILLVLMFYREKELFGILISKGLFYSVLGVLKSLIILLYTTGLKFTAGGEMNLSENKIVFANNENQKEFTIEGLGLIDIRESGKNIWTGKKYFLFSFENYDNEIFRLNALDKSNVALLANLIESWKEKGIKVNTFNKLGLKGNLI